MAQRDYDSIMVTLDILSDSDLVRDIREAEAEAERGEMFTLDHTSLVAANSGSVIAVPAGVLAQAWRGGPRQARIARLMADPRVSIPPLDDVTARAVGLLCGRRGHPDVVDVHVALHARQHRRQVVTSDEDDMRAVDPSLALVIV